MSKQLGNPSYRFHWSCLAFFLLAFAIALHRLDTRTWHGDELGSVFEAQRLGLNANSMPYFALLRIWIQLGVNEFWLRALSVLASVTVLAVTYVWARRLSGAKIALFAALLLATSPFLIVYAQQVRFYTVGLLGAAVATWAFVNLSKNTNARTIPVWLAASGLAVLALLMNVLLIIGQVATLFILTPRLRNRSKTFLCLAAFAIGVGLIAIPAVRGAAFNALAFYTNAQARYDFSRGWSLGQVAKIPLTLYFFAVGESVHPLTLILVIPTCMVWGIAMWRGARALWSNPRAFWFSAATMTLSLVLMFLVFDPLAPATLQGAATRYLIFLLPLFCFILAAGVQTSRWLFGAMLVVNFTALGFYWFGDWAYTDDLVNWRGVKSWVAPYVTPQTKFLLDGQARSPAEYYFPRTWERDWLHNTNTNAPRVIALSYNWHPEARIPNTQDLRALETRYELRAALAQYPLFVQVYDRKPSPGLNALGATGHIPIPSEIYGLEFQDLHLPFQSGAFSVTHGFGLPALDGATSETIRLDQPMRARKIILLSHLINARDARDGTVAANLRLIGEDELTRVLPVRVGYETAGWDAACRCRAVYSWHKRLALVGFQAYPDAWRDFDAQIFSAELNLDGPFDVRALEIERLAPFGKFYVWGIMLE